MHLIPSSNGYSVYWSSVLNHGLDDEVDFSTIAIFICRSIAGMRASTID